MSSDQNEMSWNFSHAANLRQIASVLCSLPSAETEEMEPSELPVSNESPALSANAAYSEWAYGQPVYLVGVALHLNSVGSIDRFAIMNLF